MIDITELRSGLRIQSFSHVGKLRLGDVDIVVMPKLEQRSLLNLLCYAYGFHKLSLFDEVSQSLFHAGFADLLVSQLVAEASDLIARGLPRAYVPRTESLSTPRGRIDIRQ